MGRDPEPQGPALGGAGLDLPHRGGEDEEEGGEGATQASTANPNTFEVESDRELTANFEPAAPTITGQPGDLRWNYGDESERTLSVDAVAPGYTLSYQWYRNGTKSTEGGTEVGGATGPTYKVPSGTRTGAGTYYYYCVVTNTKDGKTATAASGVAAVTVDKAPLTITTGSASKTYDGKALTNPDAKITGLVGGETAAVEGTGAPLAFTFKNMADDSATFGSFAGIEVDGKPVPEKSAAGSTNYTAVPGSVVVKLQPSYLETLSPGAHTITALFDDGDCLGNLMSARLDKLMRLSKAVDLLVGSCQFPLWSLEVLAGMSSQFGFPRKPCCHLVLYPGSFEVRDIFPSPCH